MSGVFLAIDGIYFQVRLDDERSCFLVIMGADANGKKELIAIEDGYRESKTAWKEMPKLAVGDSALGFWAGSS